MLLAVLLILWLFCWVALTGEKLPEHRGHQIMWALNFTSFLMAWERLQVFKYTFKKKLLNEFQKLEWKRKTSYCKWEFIYIVPSITHSQVNARFVYTEPGNVTVFLPLMHPGYYVMLPWQITAFERWEDQSKNRPRDPFFNLRSCWILPVKSYLKDPLKVTVGFRLGRSAEVSLNAVSA